MPATWRSSLTAGIAVVCATVLAGCGGDDGALTGRGTLADRLHGTGLTLYLPELAGGLPAAVIDAPEPGVRDMDPGTPTAGPALPEQAEPTAVEVAADSVIVTYTRGDDAAYRLLQGPVPHGPLCRAVSRLAGSECTEDNGVMRATMEEMATVAVVRDGTLLVLRDLVVETRPGIVDAAVRVLRRAPTATPEQLAALGG